MIAATAAAMSEEDNFRSMAARGLDRSCEEELQIRRAEMVRSLRDLDSYQQSQLHGFTGLERYESLVDSTNDFIKILTRQSDDCRRGAAHFADKDPAVADTLRSKAAWSDARRREAWDIVAGARRLREICLRTVAEAAEEDIVDVAAVEYFAYVASDSIPEFADEAMADQVHAQCTGFKHLVEAFAQRAVRLRRAASEFRAEDYTAALRKSAAIVETLCADTESFLQKIMSSPHYKNRMSMKCLQAAPEHTRCRPPQHTSIVVPLLLVYISVSN
jgi:hypothetical protein